MWIRRVSTALHQRAHRCRKGRLLAGKTLRSASHSEHSVVGQFSILTWNTDADMFTSMTTDFPRTFRRRGRKSIWSSRLATHGHTGTRTRPRRSRLLIDTARVSRSDGRFRSRTAPQIVRLFGVFRSRRPMTGSDWLKWPRGDGYIWPHRFGLAGGLVLV